MKNLGIQDSFDRETCRLCDSKRLDSVIELAPTPPGNHFRTSQELEEIQECYPLELRLCLDCSHIQLDHVVDPQILYQQDYSYVSGTSSVFVEHLREYAESSITRFSPSPGDLVIDIGSNDGTADLVSYFRPQLALVPGSLTELDKSCPRSWDGILRRIDELNSLHI